MNVRAPVTRRRDGLGWLLLAALCGAFFVLSTRWLGFYAWGIDEGMYVMRARMMADGFALYRDIWFNQPPLLVLAVRAMFDARGESVEAARLVPLALATLGLAATAAVARALGGWRAAFAAAALLVLSPLYFSLSRAVMATLPALSLAMASMALVVGYRAAVLAGRGGRRSRAAAAALAAASGLAFGLGLAIKLIALPWLLPLLLIALDGHVDVERAVDRDAGADRGGWRAPRDWPWRRIAVDALVWTGATAVPVVVVLRAYGPAALFAQAVGSLVTAREASGLDVAGNVAKLLEAVGEGQLAVVALGVFAIALGLSGAAGDGRRLWRIVALWLAVGLAAVLLHSPIWSHHYILLVYPLAAAAGCGLVAVVDVLGWGRRWRRSGTGVAAGMPDKGDAAGMGNKADIAASAGWRAFAWCVAGAALLSLPVQAVRLRDSTRAWDDAAGEAIARLGEVARPGDYIVTDSPMIAFRAGLKVPPDLCDPGKKRIDSGALTVDDVIADIERYQPSAVLFWEGRLSRGPFGGFPARLAAAGYGKAADLDVRAERWLYVRSSSQRPTTPP